MDHGIEDVEGWNHGSRGTVADWCAGYAEVHPPSSRRFLDGCGSDRL